MRARVPHSAGDFDAGRRRHVLAERLEQLADEAVRRPVGEADLAAGRQTRSSSAAALSWFGVNITPKVETHDVELRIGERQRLGVGLLELDREPSAAARARPRSSSAGT